MGGAWNTTGRLKVHKQKLKVPGPGRGLGQISSWEGNGG
jgi:hypothetical protein